jgi:hypothetical protein
MDEKEKCIVIKSKLRYVLGISKCNHKIEILKEDTIKRAHIYCKINQLSGQISGPLIEHFIKDKYCMKKNNASLCNGDLQHNDINYEIKISNGGKENNKFNYVQLRMNHDCVYIFTAYYISVDNIDNEGELYIFKLNKDDVKRLILAFGGYAHGTVQKLGQITAIELDNSTNDKEYSIRPKYGDKCWNELLTFRVDEIGIL